MNIADLISLMGLAQGLILGVVILFSHRKWRPTLLLGLFILTLSVRILPFLLTRSDFGDFHLETKWVPLYFWYTSLPLLYLYTLQLTDGFRWRRDWWHLLPGAVEIILFTGLYVADITSSGELFAPVVGRRIFVLYILFSAIPSAGYGFLIFRHLNRTRDALLNYYSDLTGKDLRWLKVFVVYLFAFGSAYLFMRFGPVRIERQTVVLFGAVANTLGIYYITIHGIRQVTIRRPRPDPVPENPPEREVESAEPAADHSALFAQVEAYMRKSQCYLKPQLTIADLSTALQVSERTLSRAINGGGQQHFNGYVNRYRIEHAKRLLRDERYDRFNLEGIAVESGFNNKATFYRAFKIHSATSPAVYRRTR